MSDVLSAEFTPERVASALPQPGCWRPYPDVSDRVAWNAISPADRDRLIAAGGALLGTSWPELKASVFAEFARDGNRTHFEDPHFARRSMLESLVLAECVEGAGRFLDDIVNGIWAICEESFWGVSAHSYSPRFARGLPDTAFPVVDLFAAETGALLAWVHVLIAPALADSLPVVLDRIEREIDTRLLTPYLTVDDWMWLGLHPREDGRPPNNWNPWIHSNLLATALLLEPDRDRLGTIVNRAIAGLDAFLAGYHEDGGCDEGTSYWGRAGASLFECLEWLRLASGGALDGFDIPLIQEIGRYIYRAHIANDWYVNFADGPARTEPDAQLLYRYGTRIGDERLQAQAAEAARHEVDLPWRRQSIGRTLPAIFDPIPAEILSRPAPLILHSWLPGIQVLTARQQEGIPEGLFLAAKGGHNAESHNHNDVGTFIVALDGVPQVIDVGVETYTAKTFGPDRYSIWTMRSPYHNLPTIDHHEQMPGLPFEARDVDSILAPDHAELTLDLAHAYPDDAGIERWVRSMSLERGDTPAVVLRDDYALNHTPNDLALTLMLRSEPIAVSSSVYDLPTANSALRIELDRSAFEDVSVERIDIADARLAPVWGGSLYRMVLKAALHREGRWEVRFLARDQAS